MTGRVVTLGDRKAWVAEAGNGEAVLYLHGFADIHGASADFLPFHRALAENWAITAPAHPGCAGTDEDHKIKTIDDVVFHYLELLDALGLEKFSLVGSCVGGWIAAEFAIRHPERVTRLALIGATGLFVPGHDIADIFWHAQPANGVELATMREMLFADQAGAVATGMYPDGRGEIDQEMLRFKMFRLAGRIGFAPPYLHNRLLRDRLGRYRGPALVLWGADDRLVPASHGEAYAAGLAGAELRKIPGGGHSLVAERPEETAEIIGNFLSG